MSHRDIGVSKRLPLLKTIPLILQYLLAICGATALVPIYSKLILSTVLLFNGIGTLLYFYL